MEGAAVIGVAVTRASVATPHTHTHTTKGLSLTQHARAYDLLYQITLHSMAGRTRLNAAIQRIQRRFSQTGRAGVHRSKLIDTP